MKLGSLCSGAGGLDMAVESVFGAETVWHCETDPAASKVLAARWPGVPNHSDLITTDWTAVEPIDILCAGWPCQPFSAAGKRKGAADERAIWPHIAGAVRLLRPRFVCLENVSAVLGPEFSRVADSLAALGYDVRWTCLRASDIGAPHRRERLFVVADTEGERRARRDEPQPQLVEDGHEPAYLRSSRPAADSACDGWDEGWPESARLVGGSDAAVSSDGHVELLPTPVDLLPTPRTSDINGAGKHGDGGLDLRTAVTDLLPTPKAHDGEFATPRTSGRPIEKSTHLQTIASLDGSAHWGKYAPAIQRWESLTRPAPAPTEPNRNNKPRLNPAFSEWMMGWPAGWVTDIDISRNDQLRVIGNGVVVQAAAAAFQSLLQLEAVA